MMIEALRGREMTTGASRVFGLLLFGIASLLSIPAARAPSRLGWVAGPQPDFVSVVTLAGEGDWLRHFSEDPSPRKLDGVASVSWEEFRIAPGGPGGAGVEQPMGAGVRRYDGGGHETERVERNPSRDSVPESRMTSEYRNGLLVRTSSRSFLQATGKETREEVWETFEYDAAGRLTEFRRGRGQKLENHFANRYDASGRIVRRETRGANDTLVNTEEFRYPGPATVEIGIVSPDGKAKRPDKLRLDDAGRVIEWWTQEGIHVRWEYDPQGRVIEQATDGNTSAGFEVYPIPGTIRTRYEARAREQVFLSASGKPLLRRTAQIERDGSISSIRSEIVAGAKTEDAPEVFAVIKALASPGARNYTESTWDNHDNWIERRWYSQPNGGSPVLHFVVRRTIVYR